MVGRATKRKNSNQLTYTWLVQIHEDAQVFVHLLDCWEMLLLASDVILYHVHPTSFPAIFTLIPNFSSLHHVTKNCWKTELLSLCYLRSVTSVGKTLPFFSHMSVLAQPLHSSTGIAARWAEPQWSYLSCMWVFLSPSSFCPGPSEKDIRIRWSITILLEVTKLFRTWWPLLRAKAWRDHSVLLIFCMYKSISV